MTGKKVARASNIAGDGFQPRSIVDINGDGLPDWVTMTNTGFGYYFNVELNLGYGFSAAQFTWTPVQTEGNETPQWSTIDSSAYVGSTLTAECMFLDLTGCAEEQRERWAHEASQRGKTGAGLSNFPLGGYVIICDYFWIETNVQPVDKCRMQDGSPEMTFLEQIATMLRVAEELRGRWVIQKRRQEQWQGIIVNVVMPGDLIYQACEPFSSETTYATSGEAQEEIKWLELYAPNMPMRVASVDEDISNTALLPRTEDEKQKYGESPRFGDLMQKFPELARQSA